MLKYGGEGNLKQACVLRRCENPTQSNKAYKVKAQPKIIYPTKESRPPSPVVVQMDSSSSKLSENENSSSLPRLPIPPRSNDRPKLSYSALIAMAIQNSPGQRATLSGIYDWIQDAFPYFARIDKGGWQNSIRHNLSLHKAFYRSQTNLPARKGGGEWRINPNHSIGAFKKVIKSHNRPKTVKLDESFWEPDNEAYADDSNPLNSSTIQIQISLPETSNTQASSEPVQILNFPPTTSPVKKKVLAVDERRQSIEEFIEMSLGGSSPVKCVQQVPEELIEVPLPPQSISTVESNQKNSSEKIFIKLGKNGKAQSFDGNTEFYEAYDPEVISQNGTSVITSGQSLIKAVDALCFLCGSSAENSSEEEEMLLCKCCCEPYHPFCLNPEELPQTSEAQINWVCRKCIQCQICGRNEGDRMRCNNCNLAFHDLCLLPR